MINFGDLLDGLPPVFLILLALLFNATIAFIASFFNRKPNETLIELNKIDTSTFDKKLKKSFSLIAYEEREKFVSQHQVTRRRKRMLFALSTFLIIFSVSFYSLWVYPSLEFSTASFIGRVVFGMLFPLLYIFIVSVLLYIYFSPNTTELKKHLGLFYNRTTSSFMISSDLMKFSASKEALKKIMIIISSISFILDLVWYSAILYLISAFDLQQHANFIPDYVNSLLYPSLVFIIFYWLTPFVISLKEIDKNFSFKAEKRMNFDSLEPIIRENLFTYFQKNKVMNLVKLRKKLKEKIQKEVLPDDTPKKIITRTTEDVLNRWIYNGMIRIHHTNDKLDGGLAIYIKFHEKTKNQLF